ncbi:MAG: type IV pilus modification PilV family protein [Solirubrobacterales bacterium]
MKTVKRTYLRNQAGFSLLEIVIAVTIMLILIAGFAVMITASARILVFNQRNLQRMYTGRAVSEIVRARPEKFNASSWVQVDGITLNDGVNNVDILNYRRNAAAPPFDWRAMVRIRGLSIMVDVYAQNAADEY